MQNITQTLFFKAILPWEVTNLHEKNMWPHQGCHQGLGAGISPGYYEHDPSYFHVGNKKKMEPKELPFNSPPTNCIYWATRNICDSPAHDNPKRITCI